jgi:DinB superfamily
MDLRQWILDEHAAVMARFEQSIEAQVPLERWPDPAGTGGASIAWLAFHTAYHQDLAVNAVLGDRPTVLAEQRTGLGVADAPPELGLGEAEQPELTTALDLAALTRYVHTVHDRTAAWLATLDPAALSVPAAGPERLAVAGVAEAAVPWLYRMWADKPVSWFVQWEAIGHRVNHVGEMVSVRNRLGLSPF